jgi:hypothetical protein
VSEGRAPLGVVLVGLSWQERQTDRGLLNAEVARPERDDERHIHERENYSCGDRRLCEVKRSHRPSSSSSGERRWFQLLGRPRRRRRRTRPVEAIEVLP